MAENHPHPINRGFRDSFRHTMQCRRRNLAQVITKAMANVNESEHNSVADALSPDWMFRYTECVQHVSSVTLQEYWANLLAGEISHPGRFSTRSLSVLSDMNEEEAQLFRDTASLITYHDGDAYLFFTEELGTRFHLPIDKALLLEDCGLLNTEPTRITVEQTSRDDTLAILYSQTHLLTAQLKQREEQTSLRFAALRLTRAGTELLHIVNVPPNEDYFRMVSTDIAQQNPAFNFSIFPVSISGENAYINGPGLPLTP